MSFFRFFLLWSIAVLPWLTIGCNDAPNPVGANILPRVDYASIHIDTVHATSHSSVHVLINTQGSDKIMLGKFQTYEAWACLMFTNLPDSLAADSIIITSATIQLKTMYHFGDSSANLSFTIHRALTSWMGDSLTYDSLQLPNVYFESNPISRQTFATVGDTDWITFNIDTSLIRLWLLATTDSTYVNDGIIFRPTNANVIKGFHSFSVSDTSYKPTLTINYEKNGQTGTYNHTIGFSKYVAKVDSLSVLTNRQMVYVQNGISYRGFITFDSLSFNSPIIIYRAFLEVTLNSSSSVFNSYTTDSLYARTVGSTGAIDGLSYSVGQPLSTNSNIFQFNITSFVKLWLTNKSTKTIALSGYNEFAAFDLFTLYGSNISNRAFKPRIILTYSLSR